MVGVKVVGMVALSTESQHRVWAPSLGTKCPKKGCTPSKHDDCYNKVSDKWLILLKFQLISCKYQVMFTVLHLTALSKANKKL